MPEWLTLKVGAMIFGAVAILSFVLLAFHWKHQAADRAEKLAIICKATGEAADNPKLGCGNVVIQIQQLGASLKNTTDALNRQNGAVNAWAVASKKAQDEAVKAQSAAKERVKAAEGQSDRLALSAGDPARLKAPCQPSDALKGSWR